MIEEFEMGEEEKLKVKGEWNEELMKQIMEKQGMQEKVEKGREIK